MNWVLERQRVPITGIKGEPSLAIRIHIKKNKHHGSALSEPGLKTEGGYYYVRISKLFPKISGMDFSKPVKDRRKINDLQFLEFVDLILKRTYVPRTTFAKFVNVDDSQLYHEKSKYFGKTITYHKNYKLVYLRQGDGLRGHEILVTFDKLNRQIDVKTFPYYCTPCSKEELLAHLSFSTRGDEFNIKYFLPENQNVIPKENEINVSKEEEWMIDEKGIFVLK